MLVDTRPLWRRHESPETIPPLPVFRHTREKAPMTVSIRVVNAGNTTGDTVRIHHAGGKDDEVLERGDVSGLLSPEFMPKMTGFHGKGQFAGEVGVTTETRHTDPPPATAEGHSIGWAVLQLKQGQRVCRPGWNGKGMYLYLNEYLDPIFREGYITRCEPCITMHTAQGKEQPGWLASQMDLLATDWELAE